MTVTPLLHRPAPAPPRCSPGCTDLRLICCSSAALKISPARDEIDVPLSPARMCGHVLPLISLLLLLAAAPSSSQCFSDCRGRGSCSPRAQCECFGDFEGADCSKSASTCGPLLYLPAARAPLTHPLCGTPPHPRSQVPVRSRVDCEAEPRLGCVSARRRVNVLWERELRRRLGHVQVPPGLFGRRVRKTCVCRPISFCPECRPPDELRRHPSPTPLTLVPAQSRAQMIATATASVCRSRHCKRWLHRAVHPL